MTVVNVTKIRAVIEDPREPNLSCYSSDIATLAAVAVSKIFANHQTTHTPKKADTNMISINSSNPNYMSDDDVLKASKKRYIPGIMGIDNPVALVKTLNRLGLCSNEMADPLQKLAAQKRPLAEFFTVSVHEVDRALKDVECSPQDRIGFKNSLLRAKLMTA
jgi:hypothetical protein